tara:strand:- start:267 stop:1268 length:1002 start_codon:yes stop_codon:yes gene_type:complete
MALDITNTFTAGEAIVASQMNTNFTEVENYINNSMPALGTANTFTGTNAFNAAATFGAAVTLNSTLQANGSVTIGVDGTGYDVKLFGDTASRYMEWDQSEDKLTVDGGFSVATGRSFINGGDDVDLDAVSGALVVGSADGTGQHIAIDGNEIQSKSNGTTVAHLNLQILGGQTKIPYGTSAEPSLAFSGDDNTGFYRAAADTIGFAGKLTLATALPTTSSSGYATLRRMTADGAIKEFTSSERFKKDITDISVSDAYKVLDARPIHFRDRNDDSSVPLEAGLSAESLHDSGWTYAVAYDEGTTTPRGIHYEMLVAPLIAVIKDLNTRLAAVEG